MSLLGERLAGAFAGRKVLGLGGGGAPRSSCYWSTAC